MLKPARKAMPNGIDDTEIAEVLALTEDGRYLAESRADRFPKASVGKSCIRFKRLDDLDEAELRDLLAEAGRRPAPGAV